MKFAVCNETFQDWPFERAFQFARELGYTGIEYAPFTINKNACDITAAQRAEVRQQAEDAGLEPIGLHWLLAFTEGYYLTSPDEDVRKRTGEYLAELARLCRDLGGNILVLGSPMHRNLLDGVDHDQALQLAADVIRRAVPVMEECGVTLAVEPLGPAEGAGRISLPKYLPARLSKWLDQLRRDIPPEGIGPLGARKLCCYRSLAML